MNTAKQREIYVVQEKIERSFEIFEYYVIFFIVLFSYILPLPDLNKMLLNWTVGVAFIITVIAYRVLPQQQGGRFSYTFKQKNVLMIALDLLVVTFLLAATGGAHSPFIIIYLFPIMALATFADPKYVYWFIPYFLLIHVAVHLFLFPASDQVLFEPAFYAIFIYFTFAIFLSAILIRYREFIWVLTGSKRSKEELRICKNKSQKVKKPRKRKATKKSK